jgi:hypothetical protein
MADTNVPRAGAECELLSGTVQASLVNRGQDTQLLFHDGSTILLKGVSRVDAVLPRSVSQAPPIGGEIGGDGENAHYRRDGREGLGGVGE